MNGFVHGSVRLWLRLEGLSALVVAVYLYAQSGYSWVAFAALFLVPDISFAGYLWGPRSGALVYNLAHSYVGPFMLAVAARTTGAPLLWPLIWTAHIGFDRALGYGLKYPAASPSESRGIPTTGPAAGCITATSSSTTQPV